MIGAAYGAPLSQPCSEPPLPRVSSIPTHATTRGCQGYEAMAKKRRRLPKRILKRPTKPIPMEKPVHELPDRRAMEGGMRGLLGGLVGPREETPLSKAQDLMYKAFESHDPMERVEFAKKALELCPDCADAYVLLAEHTKNRKEAL